MKRHGLTFSTTLSPWSRGVNKQQEVEEAVDVEAKSLGLADGGALLESLRTRRLLESAELALKVRKSFSALNAHSNICHEWLTKVI